jgi:hypothetical protein
MTKQHILHEIQRAAVANGGKPLGRLTFYNATGISENDWSGKYWSKWSDAIREAGLSPNKMTVGYEEDFLLQKLVEFTRELGHFPVSREIRLKTFNQRGFPTTKTYEVHFGTKDRLVLKAAEYCRKKGGLGDVLQLCQAVAQDPKVGEKSREGQVVELELGLVYLIKSGRFYKIGRTNAIGRRVYDLAIQLAEKPTTIHVIKTDDPSGVEKYWHQRFSAKRKGGEWFDLNAADVKAFKRWLRIA